MAQWSHEDFKTARKLVYQTLEAVGVRSLERWDKFELAWHLRRCMTDLERVVPEKSKELYLRGVL